ncbi:amidohydrolase [Caloramator sp. mosi_1]|uniref:M20 metallopeptidase family protein n=1 Tax=Caloramator sp. mosi_1 TaxID=3023090 RepID=UPI00236217A3|nr:amidohydrolase [Caloramator sp. mosi_1]WDC83970.1 amidohydrolase [Caloramator sp. mosi_1]
MHACGHDAHTAIQLGSCILLKQYEHLFNGKVRFIFQPAEETDGGAKDMIHYGALDNVSFISGLHVEETLDTGIIGINRGIVSAASNPFKIIIKGKGAHGAHPEDGIDPIIVASKIIDNVQVIISREISALNSAVITIGKINGGTAPNAIAEEVVLEGIIRTLGNTTRKYVIDRFLSILKLTSETFRSELNIDLKDGYPSFTMMIF